MTKTLKRKLYEIAEKEIPAVEGRGDLEERKNDEDDFLDISVWSLEAALQAAYELGKKEASK